MTNSMTYLALAIGAIASATDLRTRRIPNWLTFGSAIVAVLAHAAQSGLPGMQHAAVGWAVGILIFFPVFLLGGMGAGDVKLLGAFGAVIGAADVLWLAAYASLAGGVLGVAVALRNQYAGALFSNIWTLLRFWSLAGIRPLPALTLERGTGPRLAYAVPLSVGMVVTLWLR